MAANPQISIDNERIESWKRIAAYFGRDERTVKRWEKERALPIHRMPGERGGVFAFSAELAAWWNSPSASRDVDKQTVLSDPEPLLMGPEAHPHYQADANSTRDLQELRPDHDERMPHSLAPILAAAAILAFGAATATISHYSSLRHSGVATAVATPIKTKAEPPAQAKEDFLLGRYYWEQRTKASLNSAVDAYTQAVVQYPQYAMAYAGLAESYDLMPQYGSMPNSEAFPRAIAAATRAIQLDPSLGEAHRALAFGVFYWDWDTIQADAEYRKAIALDPNDKEAHHWYATALLTMRRGGEAEAEIAKARELDPASRAILADEALIRFWAGDRNGSIETLQNIERSEPEFITAPRFLAAIYRESKDYPSYLEASRRAATLSGNPEERKIIEAAERGWKIGGATGMFREMEKVQKAIFQAGNSSGYELAYTYAMLGQKDNAVDSLNAAFQARDYMLMTIFTGQLHDALRGYAPFEAVQSQVGKRMRQQENKG